MRLDLFLKASRLCPRRTVAQELCDAGAVLVNGTAGKSARAINAGDEISLRRRNRQLSVRVLTVPTTRQTARSDASSLYEILSEETISDDLIGEAQA
jgi:ribosomal 50S subunit-recycling heat shock protein